MQSFPEDRRVSFVPTPGSEEKKTLLLRDFRPVPTLRVPTNDVLQARFPVIEFHTHINDAEYVPDHFDPSLVVDVLDQCNIEKAVILTGMFGEQLQRCLEENVSAYPDRFIVFTQLDWTRFNEPDFAESMVGELRDGVARGARGLKLNNHLGLDVFDETGEHAKVDDTRLDPVWEECGRLGIPVNMHISDPAAFFQRNGPTNERYEELVAHPDWNFSRPGYPDKMRLLEARNRVFARHPDTTFIGAHVGNYPENLDYVSALLDEYPNVLVDLAERQAELGRQPRRAGKFIHDYQDRILFGTDATTPDLAKFRSYFRWLETDDEYFDYWGWPDQGHWRIYGLGLGDDILEKVYRLNAERVLAQFKGLG
jgi:predicted TIM-barrel fold metal-dependent hydrolase